ncbi:unnamed protein product, partial [Ranitomeya imitator]
MERSRERGERSGKGSGGEKRRQCWRPEDSETVTIPDSTRDDKYDENLDETEEEQMLEGKINYNERMRCSQMRWNATRSASQKPVSEVSWFEKFPTPPWDPKENLPETMPASSSFMTFSGTRNVGWYVTVHLTGVGVSVLEHFKRGRHLFSIHCFLTNTSNYEHLTPGPYDCQ